MRPGEVYYGADHLPRRRGGADPVRPAWLRNDRPTNRKACDSIPDTDLLFLLTDAGLAPGVVRRLVRDRRTAGGRWRITQELGL